MRVSPLEPVPPALRRALRSAVVRWFRREKRSLPWRDDPSGYRVWVAEIMAQQTRLETVTPYFERFLERFPSVDSLAESPQDMVLALWSGLGYYTRARNLHRAAQVIVERHGGRIPRDPKVLRTLPGIGPYTAGAIASIAYGIPAPILDGNVIRVLTRLFDIDRDVRRADARKMLWELAASLVPERNPRTFNEGLMELGALVCTPRAPDCPRCPVKRHCAALQRGTVLDRPVKGRGTPPVDVRLYAAVIRRVDGAVLLVQNEYAGLFGGLWQVPLHPAGGARSASGGKAALKRAVKQATGLTVSVHRRIGRVTHTLSHRNLKVEVYPCEARAERPLLSGYRAFRWIRGAGELDGLGVAALTRKILGLADLP